MSAEPPLEYEQLAPVAAARVDAACDAFEEAWKAVRQGAKAPEIERFLHDWGDTVRPVLLQELTDLDRDCRQRYGSSADTPPGSHNWPRVPGLELLKVLGSGGMGVV